MIGLGLPHPSPAIAALPAFYHLLPISYSALDQNVHLPGTFAQKELGIDHSLACPMNEPEMGKGGVWADDINLNLPSDGDPGPFTSHVTTPVHTM